MKNIFENKLWCALLLLPLLLLSTLFGPLTFRGEAVLAESFSLVEEVEARDYLAKSFPEGLPANWNFDSCPIVPQLSDKLAAADEVNAKIEEYIKEYVKVLEAGEVYGQGIKCQEYRYGDMIALEFTAYVYGLEYFNKSKVFQLQLPEGKLLHNEDILSRLGLSDCPPEELFEDSICANYHPVSTFNYPAMNRFSRDVLAHMILDSWQEDNQNYDLYFDDGGKLLFHYQSPAFGVYHIEAIAPQKRVDLRLNPLYEKVARRLDINPYHEDAPLLLLAFLGQVNAGEELADVLSLERRLAAEHQSHESAGLLFDVTSTDYGFERLAGNEFYLAIPKYERQVVNMMFVEEANPETMASVGGYYDALPATLGKSVVLVQNWRGQERIYAIGSFYRDRELFLQVEVNSNKELINLPANVVDIGHYIRGLASLEYTWYDVDIFDELIPYIGMG